MSIPTLRPPRPIAQIYLEAAKVAIQLATRAELLEQQTYDKKHKNLARDNAAFARRFAAKAEKAAQMTFTIMDDGALKSYCSRFDKVFEQFVKFAEKAEKELEEIELEIE